MHEGPFFSALPDGMSSSCDYVVAWKQHNNGTTFLVSPWELPWLADEQIEPRVIEMSRRPEKA
jgi:hypothetical protein